MASSAGSFSSLSRPKENKDSIDKFFLLIHHLNLDDNRVLLYKTELSGRTFPCFPKRARFRFTYTDVRSWIEEACVAFGFSFQISYLRDLWYERSFNIYGSHNYHVKCLLVLESCGSKYDLPAEAEWMTPSAALDNFPGVIEPADQDEERGRMYQHVVPWAEIRTGLTRQDFQIELLTARYIGAVLQVSTTDARKRTSL